MNVCQVARATPSRAAILLAAIKRGAGLCGCLASLLTHPGNSPVKTLPHLAFPYAQTTASALPKPLSTSPAHQCTWVLQASPGPRRWPAPRSQPWYGQDELLPLDPGLLAWWLCVPCTGELSPGNLSGDRQGPAARDCLVPLKPSSKRLWRPVLPLPPGNLTSRV